MGTGLKIRNSGVVQIDSSYFNMALQSKGTLNCSAARNSLFWYGTLDVVSASGLPPLAIRSTTRPHFVFCSRLSTTTFRYFVYVYGGSATVSYWVFQPPVYEQGAGGAGLLLRNGATGNVTFDSRKKYMNILQQYSGTLDYFAGQVIDLPFSHSNIAVIQGARPEQVNWDLVGTDPGGGEEWLYLSAYGTFQNLSSTIRIRYSTWFEGQFSSQQGPAISAPDLRLIVIDTSRL